MRRKNILAVALMALTMLTAACGNKADVTAQKTETLTLADSTKYAQLTMEVELPVAQDGPMQTIRQQLVAMLAERLTHVASPEGEQFYAPFSGDTDDTPAMMDYYLHATMILLDSLSRSDAADRELYIREDGELSEAEIAERLAEMPTWGYDYTLKMIEDTTTYVVYLSQDYIYMGGAHGGVSGDGSLTFDKETGQLVEQFLDPSCVEAIQPLLIEGLLSYYSDNEVKMTEEELFETLQIEGRQIPLPAFQPSPTKNGLVFTYQQYEIASYADGMPSFTLPYDRLLPYLTPEAKKVCSIYIQ